MIATLLRIALILMPFLVYVMWLRAVRRQQKIEAAYRQKAIDEAEGRMARAIGFAVAAAVAVILYIALKAEHHPRGAVYVPPHTEGGAVVPGGFIDLPAKNDGGEKAAP